MSIRVVSFDCADTLLATDWNPSRFTLESCQRLGIELDRQVGQETLDRMLMSRWRGYQQLNATRDHELCREFWRELLRDWLDKMNLSAEYALPIYELGDERLYGPNSEVFELYPEVLQSLTTLKESGYRLIVLSNWDYSLHRVMESFGLTPFFDLSIASLEEGVEKPDTQLFRIAESRIGAQPEEILHVGDNPLDDVQGARNAGWHAILIDRSSPEATSTQIPLLSDVAKVIEWIG